MSPLGCVRRLLVASPALVGAESSLDQVLVTFGEDHDWQGGAGAVRRPDRARDPRPRRGAARSDDHGIHSGIAYALSGVDGSVLCTIDEGDGGRLPRAPDGLGSFTFLWDSAYLGEAGLSAGAEVFSQCWYGDPGSASTTGQSDGLSFASTL